MRTAAWSVPTAIPPVTPTASRTGPVISRSGSAPVRRRRRATRHCCREPASRACISRRSPAGARRHVRAGGRRRRPARQLEGNDGPGARRRFAARRRLPGPVLRLRHPDRARCRTLLTGDRPPDERLLAAQDPAWSTTGVRARSRAGQGVRERAEHRRLLEPVWNILDGLVVLLLANAREVKAVPGRKTDVKDGEWLAESRVGHIAAKRVAAFIAYTVGSPRLAAFNDAQRRKAGPDGIGQRRTAPSGAGQTLLGDRGRRTSRASCASPSRDRERSPSSASA
jgi:hypothetical protein